MVVKTVDGKLIYGCYVDYGDECVLRKITTDHREAADWVDNTGFKVIDEVPDEVAEKHGFKISS